MSFLGVDYGRKYVGLAISSQWDGQGWPLVTPLEALSFGSSDQVSQALIGLCSQYNTTHIVFGIPVASDGREGGLSPEIRKFAEEITHKARKERGLNLSAHFTDERLTSFEAGALVRGVKKTRLAKRKLENSLAACLILQSFLELNPEFSKA